MSLQMDDLVVECVGAIAEVAAREKHRAADMQACVIVVMGRGEDGEPMVKCGMAGNEGILDEGVRKSAFAAASLAVGQAANGHAAAHAGNGQAVPKSDGNTQVN